MLPLMNDPRLPAALPDAQRFDAPVAGMAFGRVVALARAGRAGPVGIESIRNLPAMGRDDGIANRGGAST